MTSKAQRVIYIGKQSAITTGVNVDVALRAKCSFKPKVDKIEVDEDIGSYAPARHYLGSVMGEGELEFPAAYYDHLPYPISMAIADGATAFVDPDTNWMFAFPYASVDTQALYSLECTDGGNHIIRGVDVFATSLEISGEAGKAWVVKAGIVGAATTIPAAVTATPTPTASPRTVAMKDTTCAIDDAFASMGNTAMNQLISFNWKLENLWHQKLFAGNLSPTGAGNDKWKITLTLTAEVANAVYTAEIDKLLTESLSAIQIYANDSVAASTYEAKITGMYYLKEIDNLDDRDGNNIIKATYMGQVDTLGNTGAITVNSVLAAL